MTSIRNEHNRHEPHGAEKMTMTEPAVILLAHGSRDARWQIPFERLACELVAARGPGAVRLAYLQFNSPTLADAVAAAAGEGFARLLVLPLFLSIGGHVAKDIPVEVAALRSQYDGLDIRMLSAIGEDPRFTELVGRVVTESISDRTLWDS